ncbi:Fructose-bisphosphate aldolase class-II [Acididesulfobacillus acetoxydans]|uniref:D-tagatose-1,6-bisphosphate aldolase subunit GatY n=1 Tax=Acididesulfobacillus acetoxydans TaxID=1561005 RepID=A0A8S0W2R3_9FIRM|nr:class II fructose-bisphosphate aldolase [Acididesulfobacillus acetoxydans]CAA7600908.1 Fructose-bisphosphate aldolase class-II [Acididesulfobacillus acetoxydans]CEJ08935.1 D-tagatose-1,6-bisphosphate aldolase subunit GatY [Acididesulfobacillus acetoxydans]
MDLVNSKELLERARAGGYALGGFNIHNQETIQAVVEAGFEHRAPVILQATPGTVKYTGSDLLVAMARALAIRANVPIVLHLDHATDLELIEECVKAGFTSVMFDGSRLKWEENIRLTRWVVGLAHSKGLTVEAELGRIGGQEEVTIVSDSEVNYTDPGDARRFVQETGVDSLAIAIGTAHGVYKNEPKLDLQRLEAIALAVNVPLVLHGASGVPDAAITRSISLGISKINIATDLKLALAAALRSALLAKPEENDPRRYFAKARGEVKNVVSQKMRLFGIEGRA